MAAQRIRRDIGRQVLFLALAAGALAFAAWAFLTMHFAVARWGWGIAGAVAALLLWGYGTGTAGTVECPSCGKTIDKVDPKRNSAVLCPHCMEFGTGDGGMLDKTPADYVARSAVFGAVLPSNLVWPEGCCVCEQPATRMIESRLVDERPASAGRDLAVGVASLGILKAVDRTTYTIKAPHCAQHHDGVELKTPSGIDTSVALAFRSYPYYVKFRRANLVPALKLLINN